MTLLAVRMRCPDRELSGGLLLAGAVVLPVLIVLFGLEGYAILLVFGGAALLLAKYPEAGLVLYATALGFLDPAAEAAGIRQGLRALPLAAFLVALHWMYWVRRKRRIALGPTTVVALAMGALLLAGLAWTPSPEYGVWKAEGYVLYNLLILLELSVWHGDEQRLRRMLTVAACLGVVFSCLGVYSAVLTGQGNWSRFILVGLESFDPIWLARGLGVFALACLVLAEMSASRARRTVLISVVFCLAALVVRTASRGPALAFALTLLLYLVVFTRMRLWQRVLVLPSLLLLTYLVTPPQAQARYSPLLSMQTADVSLSDRVEHYRAAVQVFVRNPIVGVGTGGYAAEYGVPGVHWYPHNIVLELAAELGLVGLALFAAFLFLNLRVATSLVMRDPRIHTANCVAVWGLLVLTFGFLNSMVSGDLPKNSILWLGSGLMCAGAAIPRARDGPADPRSG